MTEPTRVDIVLHVTSDGKEFEDWTYAMDHEIKREIKSLLADHACDKIPDDIINAIHASLEELTCLNCEANQIYEADAKRIPGEMVYTK